jgi:hypothetical protein
VEGSVGAAGVGGIADGWHGTVMAVVLPLTRAPVQGDMVGEADVADMGEQEPAVHAATAVS